MKKFCFLLILLAFSVNSASAFEIFKGNHHHNNNNNGTILLVPKNHFFVGNGFGNFHRQTVILQDTPTVSVDQFGNVLTVDNCPHNAPSVSFGFFH